MSAVFKFYPPGLRFKNVKSNFSQIWIKILNSHLKINSNLLQSYLIIIKSKSDYHFLGGKEFYLAYLTVAVVACGFKKPPMVHN